MYTLFSLNLKWIVRDRILQALLTASLVLIMLVPVLSSFSMRQSQELAVTLSLSFISFVLLVFTLVLGSTMLWRDIERRYTYSVLSLPFDRGTYILAKFLAVAFFIFAGALFIGLCAALAIKVSAVRDPSTLPLQWGRIAVSIFMDSLKYALLAALGILVSTFSTSFFMPFFSAVFIFLSGSASQDVYEFVTSSSGMKLNTAARVAARVVYYIVPNFGAFNFKLQAIYPIPLDPLQIVYAIAYFIIYTTMALSLAIWCFSRRELT